MEFISQEGINNVIERSHAEDVVSDSYKIHLDNQLLELSNEFCKYYSASKLGEEKPEYFAIVYDEKFLPPVDAINLLINKQIEGINLPKACSIVQNSSTKSEHLVVIVEQYDYHNNLRNHIIHKGKLSVSDIQKIVNEITKTLDHLSSLGILSVNLNTENIILNQGGNFLMLREFIDGPVNYHQLNEYIAPELLECHKAARDNASIKTEVYALGIVAFYAFSGVEPWEEYSSALEYNEARLDETSFKLLSSKAKLIEKMRIFLKWTLMDDASHRWGYSQINEWSLNQITSATTYDSLTENKNTVGFNDKSYSTMKALCYSMFHHWDKAIKFIREDKIYKWIARENMPHETLNNIKEVLVDGSNVSASNLHANYKLAKLFSLMDPYGSIRLQSIALSAKSIPAFLYYLMMHNKKHLLEPLLKVLKERMWDMYSSEESAGHLPENMQEDLNKLLLGFNANSSTKGFERLMYSLNPHARCLSKLLDGKYITTVADLVEFLEIKAQDKSRKLSFDKQIVAFVSARLNVRQDIKPAILSNFSRLNDHPVVRNLSVMEVIQQQLPDIEIVNLYNQISDDLLALFEENLHHLEFKKRIIKSIKSLENERNFTKLVKALSNQQQFINDYNGYQEACRQVMNLKNKIAGLSSSKDSNTKALLIGQKITVLISYILCFVVTITVLI